MYWMVPYTRKVRNRWISRSRKYWAGQKVRLGLSVTSYGKTWMNFSANPVQDKVKAHSTTRVPRLPKLQTKARSHWPELPQPAGLCLPSQSPLTVISGKSPNTFVPLPSRWSIDGSQPLKGILATSHCQIPLPQECHLAGHRNCPEATLSLAGAPVWDWGVGGSGP